MKLRFLLTLIVLCGAGAAQGAPNSAAQAARMLHHLFADDWERSLREAPENASALGDARYNDRWTDLSLPAIAQRHAEDEAVLGRLKKIPRAALSADDRLNYDLFELQYHDQIDGYRFRQFVLPIDQRNGPQLADELTEILPFATVKDYDDWTTRLQNFGVMMDQTLALMRQGVTEQRTNPRIIMQRVPEQIAKQNVADPQDSPFYAPFKRFPKTISADEQTRLAAAARDAITQTVLPAFARLQNYYTGEYLPASRASIGASEQPDGKAFYAWAARHYTTTELTPAQIHHIGLKEVARIRGEMDQVIAQSRFKGSFQEFLDYLRTDPKFFFKTGDELLSAYAALAKRIDPELVKLFGTLPRLPYGVRPIPANNAPNQTTAYYQPGAADGSRAGNFYVNLYKPEARPKWEMEALTLHEAVPGHHLQLSLGQELGALPMFRRNASFTAFVEGWGLYAESLGGDLGLYQDPYSKFGQLTYEMWRAIRLVVDTGMHDRGWSRQQAIDLFKANTGKSELDIANEVDRYIAWPGQALAYKIGQLKILELRERAQTQLGARFDLRAFHDVVLGSGAVPLNILERNVDGWIAGIAKARAQ